MYIVLVQWALFIPTIHDRKFSDVTLRELAENIEILYSCCGKCRYKEAKTF